MAVNDFNNDGVADLAVADAGSGNIWVLLGNGNGTFQTPTVECPTAGQLFAEPFRHGGDADLFVLNGSNSFVLSRNNGEGVFEQVPNSAAGSAPIGILLSDFNRDGNLDAVVTNSPDDRDQGAISVLLGDGHGAFGSPISYVVGTYPISVAEADFNLDGIPDLIVTIEQLSDPIGEALVLLGNGDGTFRLQTTIAFQAAADTVAVGDINGDGIPDAIVGHNAENVSILLGKGDGTFDSQKTIPTGFITTFVSVGDLNGDGNLDILANGTAGGYGDTLVVLLGNGDGTFQAPVDYGLAVGGPMVIADLNGDGKPDVALALGGSFSALIFLNQGDGKLAPPVSYPVVGGITGIAAGDFNGDGITDLAISGIYGSAVTVLIGKGDGTFTTFGFFTGSAPEGVAGGDLNGDGLLDLVTAGGTDQLTVLLNSGRSR